VRVFLIHGLARTPLSMSLLARRLRRRAGHRTHLFGYAPQLETLPGIAERFATRVKEAREEAGDPHDAPYAIVGHSLGNVITRLASPRLPPGFRRFAMLAPPCRPPSIVLAAGTGHLVLLATRDAGERLRDPEFFRSLPKPDVPTLTVAGNGGPRAGWLPFGGAPNDAILRVDETLLDGVPTIEVPAVHTFLMNHRETFRAVRAFLAGRAPRPTASC